MKTKRKVLAAALKAAGYLAQSIKNASGDNYIYKTLDFFNVQERDLARITKLSERMTVARMFKILSNANDTDKKRVCGYLTPFVFHDGYNYEKEITQLYDLLILLCDFKPITPQKAMGLWDKGVSCVLST
jgi:hypothetical protein